MSNHIPSEEIIHGVKVRRFRSFAPGEAYFISNLSLYTELRKSDAEIIHAHNIQAFPALVAAMAKTPLHSLYLSSYYHGNGHTRIRDALFKPYQGIIRYILNKVDGIICLSTYERKLMERDFEKHSHKIITIPNGLNLREFERYRWNPSARSQVLYVGRLEKYKNVDKIIKAVKTLVDRSSRAISLVIVGTGPEESTLKKLAIMMEVEGQIIWKARLSKHELLRLYANSSLLVMPSLYESYSLVVAEAAAVGLPIIVANIGTLRGYVEQGVAVGIDPPISSSILADSISHILDNLPKHRERSIDTRFLKSWDWVTTELLKVYESRPK